MSALHEWEESEGRPPAARGNEPGAGAAVAAGIALGRLDRGWAAAPAPLRAAWLRGLLDREAAASAALEGWPVPASELMAAAFDCPVAPGRDLRCAQRIRGLLAAAARRSPRQLYTPLRLLALARRNEALRSPGWDAPREASGAALEAALDPAALRLWAGLDPFAGMAALLAGWEGAGAAAEFGGAAGRVLAARWPARVDASALPLVPVALGFRARLGDYMPWRPAWPHVFASALGQGLGEALALLDGLSADRSALAHWASGRRKRASWDRAIDALFESGALSAEAAARRLCVTRRAAGDALAVLAATPHVREISGRASWRVYVPRALAA